MSFNFHIPTEIIFGNGKSQLIDSLIPIDIERILIVTDKTVYNKSGAGEIINNKLKGLNVEVFDEIEENPSIATIIRGTVIAREMEAQLVIGIGGGSPMDTAKGIAGFTNNFGNIMNFIDGEKFSNKSLPIYCIPTTSGTGSEVTNYAVFTDKLDHKKVCLSNSDIFPRYAIIDPELTYSMPEGVVINTGIDALTHAIEAMLSTLSFPMNDIFSEQSIAIILENIHKARMKDKNAMSNMAYASMLAGISIVHASTILLHIMAYPITTYYNIPHGMANGILLPSFMDFMKRKSSVVQKIESIENLFEKFGGIKNFINDLGISTDLSFYDISQDQFSKFAEETVVKDDIRITPADVTKKDIVSIYKNSNQ